MNDYVSNRELSATVNTSILVRMEVGIEELDKIRGANLRRLRSLRDWSQKDLSDKTGIEQSKISAYENGLGFNKETLVRFCQVFKVRPWEFDFEESIPVVMDAQELKDIRRRREASRVGIADMVREAEETWIISAKKKEGSGGKSAQGGLPRRGRKSG